MKLAFALAAAGVAYVEATKKIGKKKGGKYFRAPVLVTPIPAALPIAHKHHAVHVPRPLVHVPIPAPVLPTIPFFPAEYECTEPTVSCPAGFFQEGKLCEKELLSFPEMICPIGMLSGEQQNLQCIQEIGTLPSCAPGFLLKGGACTKIITEELIPICADGYTDMGDCCEKMVPAPVVEICPLGRRVGENCVVTHRNAPAMTRYCPEGFDEESGECCKVETYDCTPADAQPLECGDDDPSTECLTFRRHLGSCGRSTSCIERVRKEMKERVAAVAVVQQTCQKKLVTPMLTNTFCGAGELINGMCVLEEFHAYTMKCTAEGDEGNCFSRVVGPFQHICPAGFERAGAACVATQEDVIIPVCPAGFEMGGEGCFKTHEPVPVCGEGMLGEDLQCHVKEFAPLTTTWCTTCTGTNCIVKPCH